MKWCVYFLPVWISITTIIVVAFQTSEKWFSHASHLGEKWQGGKIVEFVCFSGIGVNNINTLY